MPERELMQLGDAVGNSDIDELLRAHREIWAKWCSNWQTEHVEHLKRVLAERESHQRAA